MSEQACIESLTEREVKILTYLAEGMSNREIADRLFLAPSTVKWYVTQLNRKLDTANRDEIVQRAYQLQLFEPLAPTAPPKHNLPHPPTPFVGRDAELNELCSLLTDPDVRLLTILAPGGMGKTRLALEAAEQQIGNFRDGVYFVPLQPLTDVDHIILTVAKHIGYQFQDSNGYPPKQQMLDYLSGKQMLLLLDNFEHLLEGAPLVTDILEGAPEVKVLVTSREKLNLNVETVNVLHGMRYPTWKTLEDALDYDAVKLLLQAAKRVKPDWMVTADDLDYVTWVCHLTEGMPLGILLAASWLDVFPLERIVEEIRKSADFLETEMRDVPTRQRSIQAVFQYSWQQLKPDEQEVFMKLSVFLGGFTPAAAETVTGAIPRVLHTLVNKALLVHSKDGYYHLHELLRQYAEELLDRSGEAETTRNAHSAYFIDFLQRREKDMKSHQQLEALNEIERDFYNICSAWLWVVKHRQVDAVDRAVESLRLYCDIRSRFQEGEELLWRAQRAFPPDSPIWGRIAVRRTWLAQLGDIFRPEDMKAQLAQSLAVARTQHDLSEVAFCLFMCGIHATMSGQGGSAARGFLMDSLAQYRNLDEPYHEGDVLTWLSFLSETPEEGIGYLRQSLEMTRAAGAVNLAAWSLMQVGLWNLFSGQLLEAEEHFQEALTMHGTQGDRKGQVRDLYWLSKSAFYAGDFEKAQLLGEEVLKKGTEFNDRFGKKGALAHLGLLSAVKDEDFSRSRDLFEKAQAFPRINLEARCINEIHLGLAISACAQGDSTTAQQHLHAILRYGIDNRSWEFVWMALPVAALLLAHKGEQERAVAFLRLAFVDPPMTGWLECWPLVKRLRARLEADLGQDVYSVAWDSGASLHVETVAAELLAVYEQRI
jgi:predicted ATPase/DNA-binding CsgD family transcriptional regulator